MNDNMTALVTLLGGIPVDPVLLGPDTNALDERGQAFVAEQGCNANYALCDVEVLPGGFQPRLQRATSTHRDFQVVIDDMMLMLIEVFPREGHPANHRRTARNRAVEFVLNLPGASVRLAYATVSLDVAAHYVKSLGLDPTPLWELARERGWDVRR
ncbi:MAG: hypothetical protein GY832_34565 [Chloroflexi bacterium]|nr:hypothetical protein [Chloroflexota bacterium]